MSRVLEGKGAIVTGGSRGIGAEIARELAKQGASVLITYARSSQAAEEVVNEINQIKSNPNAKAKAIKADAADAQKAAETTIAEAASLFDGGVDIIVNNAANGEDLELKDVTTKTFEECFIPNVLYPLLLVKLSKPVLRKKARIVNLSSVAARSPYPIGIMYGAAKAALESVTKSLAKELGHEYEATVNAVNPGPVRTEMWSEVPGAEELEGVLADPTPASPRIGEVMDIAPIVAFLCQEQSRWVTASVVNANGGLLPT
ncbi:hypothetical protein M409DRAFT_70306 [Zasmidium cellare ATCC 36951]|uniref:Uncharacterized protein n=1 Tax=Zasmidium cellare ATCC 36951 TaxID=1080233 RepID=A0A6A6C2N5_ZASCE|nr:uncharacterized protein M409DRAFT_70306 [Zasmidium cellare ATCC 36951]KAF2160548.1 hypothetical protein M409DRAFT_70306 [Zasmidium cellare ATCC 36951]